MSMDEYNRHSILGPFAGRPNTLSGVAGQEAYKRNQEMGSAVTVNAPPFRYIEVLRTYLILGAVGALSLVAAYILPEKMMAIPAFVTMGCGIGIIIVTLHAGIETAKIVGLEIVRQIFREGWWQVLAVALAALSFGEFYIYALLPATPEIFMVYATILAVLSKCWHTARPVCAALALGTITYVLLLGSISLIPLPLAAVLGAAVSGAVLIVIRLWQRRRKLRIS